MSINRNERSEFISWWMVVLGLVIFTLIVFGISKFVSKPFAVVDKVTDPDHIIQSYEEFETMYNTCFQICDNMTALKDAPDEGGFSSAQRISSQRLKLNEVIREYNAKSKQMTRNLWKSSELPYQLNYKTICNESF